ncbi:MAG: glyceraldehyde-3-phosphate dehydrogenase [Deltaproteobacteria bacterium]|nr:glyceraldehyde-3-phosphate dehydrogenase [Deltaproteobacteria bacterium]
MNKDKIDTYLEQWRDFERCAEAMLPIIGRLYRERGVIITCYGNSLVNKDPVAIIQHHSFASKVEGKAITVQDTLPILAAVNAIDLAPARIDIGNFLTHYRDEGHGRDLTEFAGDELASIATGKTSVLERPQDIVLYGFGRIGRLVARILAGKTGGGDRFRLKAIVVRKGSDDDLAKRASLLRRDSVHGPFRGSIQRDEAENAIVANGNMIRVLYADAPDKIDYTEHGIEDAILIDNTGKWRDREGLERHLKAPGVARVLLTAPGKGDIANIVYGVNHKGICEQGPILSAASCTTNAIVPVLAAINREFGIDHGHVESCHSYTNDQNLIDNYHKNARRGRSAVLNMVVSETGAAKAVGKALPELDGKFTGNAVRVPTPNVSLAILMLDLVEEATKEQLNSYLRKVSLEGDLVNQIDYTNADDVVSSDFVGNRFAGIVDAQATIAQGKSCVLYVWYDNEFGYSRQVVRILEELAGLGLPTFPKAT